MSALAIVSFSSKPGALVNREGTQLNAVRLCSLTEIVEMPLPVRFRRSV